MLLVCVFFFFKQKTAYEMRISDWSSDVCSSDLARKARQRIMPPQMLLTTPESLSLMLSWPDAKRMFGSLSTVIIDEVHAFAPTKRGDLLNLALSRLDRKCVVSGKRGSVRVARGGRRIIK